MIGFVFFCCCLLFKWGIPHRVLLMVGWCQVLYSSGFLWVSSHYLILPRVSSLVVYGRGISARLQRLRACLCGSWIWHLLSSVLLAQGIHEAAAEMPPGLQSSEMTAAGRSASKLVLSKAGKMVLGGYGRPQFLSMQVSPEVTGMSSWL